MAYDTVQQKTSSWNPAFQHEKSESLFKPRPFSVQPEADTEESEEQEIPAYTRFDRDAISANLLSTMGANVQTQAEVEGQKSESEQQEEDSEEISNETQTLQRTSESGESGAEDDNDNSSNGGAIQRQEESSSSQEEEELSPQAEVVQRQEEPTQSQDKEELSPQPETIQRQEESVPLQDDEMQAVQTKLTIGTPGDKYEQEADEMAAQVMSMEAPTASPQSIQRQSEGEEEVQRSPLAASITPLIQRFSEEEVHTKPSIQKAGESSASQADSSLESRLSSQKGGGSPLDEEVRSFMEPRFGNDFSAVRVHTGGDAVQMNKELHAQAFTHGSDIYFNEGKYDPHSSSGKELLAHELTHTIQQTGAVQAKSVTNLATKGNKVQTKTDPVTSFDAQPVIRRKENPQQPAEKDNKVQPAQPAPTAAPATDAGVGGAKSQKQTAAPKAEGGGGKAGASAASPKVGSSGGAKAAQGGNQQAASSGADVATGGVGGAKSPASPEQDPAFQAVVNKAKGVAQDKKKHDPAEAESKEAQDAAQPPANEVESKAQDKQVGEMNQQQPGEFNAEAFKAALMEKIAAVIPNNEEDAKKFKNSNELDSVRQDVSSQVTEEQKQAAGPIEEKTKAAPDTSGVEPKPVTPMKPPETGAAPTGIDAKQAAPKPKPESEISAPLEANSQELDEELAKAKVPEETLEQKSNESQFVEAVGAKKEAQAHAKEAPQAYRQEEKATINQAQAEAQTTSQTQLQGMHGQREQLLTQVMGAQSETQGKDTQERTKIANEINGIYEETKKNVETVLTDIDGEVTKKFDAGAATAKQIFENYVAQEMEAWEQKRYGEWYDVTGWDERASDAWNGLPPEVNQFFVDGRQKYLDSMDVTLTDIANFVAQKLNDAKQKITEGKQKIQEHVAGLPENLRKVGQEAAQNIQEKFNQLEESVNNKQDELIDSLAQKYSENLQQLDAEIEKKKEENKGLKDKAKDAIVGTVQTIMQLKDMLMGVLAKAAGAIDKIILDPIEFLGHLVSGIKQGFQNFVGNIWEHLKKGLLGWLTGTMAKAGIQMPESFDLKSIFTLVMQVLGLAYDAIKSRTIKALGKNGAKIFSALETTFEIFVILQSKGLAGLWQFIQDKIGDLKVMVIDTIQNFVIESVIKQGVLWVISLLNPASAFAKACKMIYDIIMFFIERGSQIAELVNAVMESVTAIAGGAVDGAAKLIENALSTALPVVISFMASLLGLGGISEKIQEIIGKVKEPIDNAIDWLIAQAVKFAKKIGKALGFGRDEEGGENQSEHGGEQLEDSEVGKTVNFSGGGEGHRLWISTQGTSTTVMVASTPTPVEAKLNELEGKLDSLPEVKRPQAQSLLASARQHLNKTEQEAQKTAKEMQEAKQNSTDEAAITEAEKADNQTEAAEQSLADVLQQLLELFGEENLEGALAAYRGIHFQASWDEEKYQNQVNKTASDIIGQPEFSKATYEVAKSLFGKEELTIQELESAAEIVRQDLETLKEVEAEELSTNPDKLDKDAQKQAYKRLIKRGITEPTSEQLNQEIESVKQEMLSPGSRYMRPITRGSEGKGTKQGFENMFYVAIHQYINTKKQFEVDLQNVATGRYTGLKFTKVPFLSTSKVAGEAAKYAFGKAQDLKDVRTEGTVGRVFVYVFSVKEQAKQGLLNIERLHKENKISRSTWLISESEVAFTGSIPGENLIGYHDAQSSQTPETVGGLAEQTARNKAATMGGLREWDT